MESTEFIYVVRALLEQCLYIEDLQALKHFVFHARLNGASNGCLLCGYGAELEGLWEKGHADDCPYPKAVARAKKHETLAAWSGRQ
jgi:hypothetical protein